MIRVLVSRSTLLRRPFATASRRFDSSLLLIKSLAKQATGTSYFYSTASSSGQSPPTNNRQRRSLQLVAGASLVAGSFCYYCLIENNTRNVNLTSSSSSRRWIHADPRSVQRLTQEQVDAILTQNQSKVLLHTNTAVVSVCHTNNVRSNDPIEDYSSNHSIPKPAAVAASGGGFWGRGNKSTTTSTPSTTAPQLLLGVYDGHGGRECANIVSAYLPAYVSKELSLLKLPASKSSLTSNPPSSVTDVARRDAVMAAIKRGFATLDADILKGGFVDTTHDIVNENDDGVSAVLRPAVAGSCALLAYIDGSDLYVACTGDSRALLLKRRTPNNPPEFDPIPLSVDQTVRNAHEYERMLDEHPGEIETLFVKGRVLGGLMPTRAFGDARYKWPALVSDTVLPIMGSRRSVPYNYKTPPYVTAVPELVHYKLDLPRPSSSGTSSSTSSSNLVGDYCLVLATDGLYDDLMNEEIGELMTGFFEKTSTRRNTTRASLSSTSTTSKVKPKFVYEDTNAATHLIRNALIAGSKNDIGGILAIPPPYCRRFRDDMTVNVIFFNNSGVTSTDGQESIHSKQLESVDVKMAAPKPDRLKEIMKHASIKSKL